MPNLRKSVVSVSQDALQILLSVIEFDNDVILRQAGVPANVSVDLAVTFPQLRPLSRANRVPDPSSGVPTRPPGAFAVGVPFLHPFMLLMHPTFA